MRKLLVLVIMLATLVTITGSFNKKEITRYGVGAKLIEPTSTPSFGFEKELVYPYFDNSKLIIFRLNNDYDYDIFLSENTKESKITSVSAIVVGKPEWSSDGKWFAFTDRPVTSDSFVHVINIKNKKEIVFDMFDHFIANVAEPIQFSHIYASFLDWYKNGQAILLVAGRNDGTENWDKIYFLVNIETGKVVKRVL